MNLTPVNIYPFREAQMFRWDYVYLHGKAEAVMYQPHDAPDLFSANVAKPKEECNILCSIGGLPALAVIRNHMGQLGGRIALLTDTYGLKHILTPEEWG